MSDNRPSNDNQQPATIDQRPKLYRKLRGKIKRYIIRCVKLILISLAGLCKKLDLYGELRQMNSIFGVIDPKTFMRALQKCQYDYNKIALLDINKYPNHELDDLLKYTNNLEIINIEKDVHNTRDIETLENISMTSLLALAKAPVIVETTPYHIVNYLNPIPEQSIIYLWHACGAFKMVGMDTLKGNRPKPNHIIVSSEGIRQDYADSFGIPVENVHALGIPRTECLQDENFLNQKREYLYNKYPQLKDKKIYLYAPTFREKPFRCMTVFDHKKFSENLQDDEILIYKMHPLVIKRMKYNPDKYICDYTPIGNNILEMNNEDVIELTIISDVIMTDYSTSFFEGMLLNKPCVFVADDVDKYERGFYINYREDLPGQIVESGDYMEVLQALRNATIEHPNYQKFKEYHLGACHGEITQRVSEFITQVYDSQQKLL